MGNNIQMCSNKNIDNYSTDNINPYHFQKRVKSESTKPKLLNSVDYNLLQHEHNAKQDSKFKQTT